MPRETFDRELQKIQDEVLVLGSMVEQAVFSAIDALKQRDLYNAQLIYHNDQRINEKRYAIENMVLTLIATQQPMARDLRFLAAILEIITELERMGDYAKGIARICILMNGETAIIPLNDLEVMAERGLDMLNRALSAFVSRDATAAHSIPDEDDEIDTLYNKVYRQLMDLILANPAVVDHANHLMWAAHNLERMADRVTNICERIVFVVTGQMMELDHSDDQDNQAKKQEP